jgi:hypothetical protein
MKSFAYGFYNQDNLRPIDKLIERSKGKPTAWYLFGVLGYIRVRKQYTTSKELIKYNAKIIKKPDQFIDEIKFYQGSKALIGDYLYKFRTKSKRIPYYGLKESFIKNINLLDKQVDIICRIKTENIKSKGAK